MLSWRAWAGHDMLFHQAVFVVFPWTSVDPKSRSSSWLFMVPGSLFIHWFEWKIIPIFVVVVVVTIGWIMFLIHGLNEKSSKISTGQNFIPNKSTLNNSKKGPLFSLRCHPFPCLVGNSRGDIKHDDGALTCYAKDKPTKIFKAPAKLPPPRNKGLVGIILGGS